MQPYAAGHAHEFLVRLALMFLKPLFSNHVSLGILLSTIVHEYGHTGYLVNVTIVRLVPPFPRFHL